LGILKQVTDVFFQAFGPTSERVGDICSGAGEAAQTADFGFWDAHDLFDLAHSRAIVIWGRNLYVSSVHLLPVVRRARAAGARIALVDPVRHRTAELAELVLQPRPGGDLALALGVARRLFETGASMPSRDWCDHLDAFRAQCFARTLGDWAAMADVPTDALVPWRTSTPVGPPPSSWAGGCNGARADPPRCGLWTRWARSPGTWGSKAAASPSP
jgi:anaerobic selenocysteine-containing dehydrogenase